MPENFEEKFNKFMKNQGMENMTKPLVYIVKIKYPDPDRPIIQKFSTKEKRDEWYKTIGKGFEEIGKVPIEFGEVPAEDQE